MKELYKDIYNAKTEFDLCTDITVCGDDNGGVIVRVGSWTERTDKSVKEHRLTAKEAGRFARNILGISE